MKIMLQYLEPIFTNFLGFLVPRISHKFLFGYIVYGKFIHTVYFSVIALLEEKSVLEFSLF